MNIKETIFKLFPSFRTRKAIVSEVINAEKKIYELQLLEQKVLSRINDLDSKLELLFWLTNKHDDEELLDLKKRTFINVPKAEGRLRKIQLASNSILQRLKTICDANAIEFFLIAGTLIGALRHHGFIPWDDDIDIGMMRDDYNKLLKVINEDDILEINTYFGRSGNRQIKVKFKFSNNFYVDIFVFDRIDITESTIASVWDRTQESSEKIKREIMLLVTENPLIMKASRPVANKEIEEKIKHIIETENNNMSFYGHGDYITFSIESMPRVRAYHGILKNSDVFPLQKNGIVYEGKEYDVWKKPLKYFENLYDIWEFPSSIKPIHSSEFTGSIDEELLKLQEVGINSGQGE